MPYGKLLLSAVALASLAAAWTGPAAAQDKIELKITTASVPNDWHTRNLQVFKDTLNELVPDRFDVQIYDSGSLFKQGPHVEALQRGNAEMTYMSFQDVASEIPEFSIFTAGYLFRNPEHQRAVMDSEIGEEISRRMAEDMDILPLDICYLGTREVNLRSVRDVKTPADLAGVKLRMPGSEAWLFLGNALGANATPMAFGEVYLGLQSGAIDGQDNPLPSVEAAKFYEVTKQVVMTDHLVDALLLSVNTITWDKLNDAEKAAMETAAAEACAWNNENRVADEARLVDFFKQQGLTITVPDVDAFRAHVQEAYMSSEMAKSWPEGWLDRINAIQ